MCHFNRLIIKELKKEMNLLFNAQNIAILIITSVLFLAITIYKQYHLRKKSRSPFSDDALLRLPGHSLNQQIQKLSISIIFYLFSMFISIILFVNIVMTNAPDKELKMIFKAFPITIGILIILLTFFLFKIIRSMNYRNKLRLGYEGELVTAQELSRIMPEGNYVYHDFQAGKFNIDHILVGPAGVFAIETKTRSKQVTGDNQKDASTIYNGKEIVFPNYYDTKYLEQARRQAKWLSNWLKSSIGEPVEVFPIISLPGWYVKRQTSYDGMFVVNPKQLKSVIKSKSVHNLDRKKIQQIVHQLDQKCRDIEIISKQYDSI